MGKVSNAIECKGFSFGEVTGSCYQVNYNGYNFLLDCGARQTQNIVDDYKSNIKMIRSIKAKEIRAIIIGHVHQDHIGIIPALYRNGCTATIFSPKHTKELMAMMWSDSAKILIQDTDKISRKCGIKATPYYSVDDVKTALEHVVEIDFRYPINLNESISFEYFSANHIVNSAQILLRLSNGINTKRVLYTSDLGSLTFDNFYCESFDKVDFANIVICESTYATDTRGNKKGDRPKDIEKIKSMVEQIKECGGKIIIPVFSLNRSQDILTMLYNIFGEDTTFNLPIVYDAVLGNKISNAWENCICKNQELWNKVWSWKNIVKITEWDESKLWQTKSEPMIALCSGGFLSGGRIIPWAKTCLPNYNNFICFVGYGGGVDSPVYQIKHGKEFPVVNIDGEKVANKARVVCLSSFSSHIDNNDMLDYYSSINCEKIYLAHGDMDRKLAFKLMLEDAISKKNRTSRVVCANMDTKINL